MSWISGNGFIPNDGPSGAQAAWAARSGITAGPFPQGSPAYSRASTDAFRPAWFGAASGPAIDQSSSGGIGTILAQLASRVQAYIGKLGSALLGTPPASGATTFANVSLGSTGDPHLSVTGSKQNADGTTANVDSHFDSMTSHPNLFSTRDFGDGFNVATTVTQPSANGVTQNASATASMDGGNESVTLTNGGAVSIVDHGEAIALSAGGSVTLMGGQRVSEAANGSVSIAETLFGRNLTTTFTPTGGGVDVTASGQNVTLSGDLIAGRG